MGVISNPIGALNNTIQAQAHNQSLMSIQYIVAQPALFAGNDFSALLPNQFTASIVTDIQAPVIPSLINQPAEFVGSDMSSLLPNQNMNASVTFIQAPTWIPAISTPQPALFAGFDFNALRPNIYTSSIITFLQNPTWLPSSSFEPQIPLFAGSDVYALRPNTIWNVPNNYLQAPEWLLLPAQPSQSAATITASLLANQIALQSQLQNAATANLVAEEDVVSLWHLMRPFIRTVIINVTEALGLVTETIVKHKSSFLTESVGSVTETVLKHASKFLSETLGVVTDSLAKTKHIFRNVSDVDVTLPTCPPGQLWDPVQQKCVVCGSGSGTGRFIRDIGGQRKLSIGRRPNQ